MYDKKVSSYLDRLPQVVAPPLLPDDVLVDLAGRDVVVAMQRHVEKPDQNY
jgi:hypothetical protein